MPASFENGIAIVMRALLDILCDGQFHSGEALGRAVGVSRSAIWKQLQRLENDLELPIHRVKGRGYKLSSALSLLGSEARLTQKTGWPVHLFDSLDSTNREAQQMLAHGAVAPFCVLAERQTAGRGRRGRRWVSPFAENVYFSLVLPVEGGARQLEGLSLTVGLAVLRTLEGYGLPDLGLKWPNDVLVGGRKIAGILLELSGDPADRCNVVIGIGLNVNMRIADAIDQPWTSLAMEVDGLIDRNTLVEALCAQLGEYLPRHFESGFASLKVEWESRHLWQGCRAVLSAGDKNSVGVITGIDAGGALRLKIEGVEQVFSGGELSLRLADDS